MANTFKNAKLAMTTGGGTVYTCPALTTAIVIGGQIANIDGVNAANATAAWTDASDSDTATNLLKTVPVAPGSAIPVVIGKLALDAGDTVTALASADGDLVITLSVLEIS
jgi:hypothetical protein